MMHNSALCRVVLFVRSDEYFLVSEIFFDNNIVVPYRVQTSESWLLALAWLLLLCASRRVDFGLKKFGIVYRLFLSFFLSLPFPSLSFYRLDGKRCDWKLCETGLPTSDFRPCSLVVVTEKCHPREK